MSKIYLGLGTNLGDKVLNIQRTINLIGERVGQVTDLSALYQSKPWGFVSDNLFINAVVEVETNLDVEKLLVETQQIETEIGRTTKSTGGNYTDRIIDIDVLLYDDIVYNKGEHLTIPHPFMLERDFVLIPLIDINKDIIHPISLERLSNYIKDKHALDKLKIELHKPIK